MIFKLSDSCIHELKSYLHDESWNKFMNTTKKFSNLLKKTRYIKLNVVYSRLNY